MNSQFRTFWAANIRPRIAGAALIGILFICSVLWLDWLYYLLMVSSAVVMSIEWSKMAKNRPLFLIIGAVIIGITSTSLILLKVLFPNSQLLLFYFIIIWTVDATAMIAGKNIGGPKLAQRISPNKTWSGFVVGIILAGLAATALEKLQGLDNPLYRQLLICNSAFISGVLLASIAQCSDLFISLFKRYFKIKDFSNAIPGHGGVMDRFDSFVLTAPLVLIRLIYILPHSLSWEILF